MSYIQKGGMLMYKEIYDFAIQNELAPIPNTSKKEIAGYINLDIDGNFLEIDIIEKKIRKKVLCPDVGSLAFGKNTNPIVEKREYMFDKSQKKHEGWVCIMQDSVKCGREMQAIYNFIRKCEDDEKYIESINNKLDESKIKAKDFLSYRVNGKKMEENKCWIEWLEEYKNEHTNTKNKKNRSSEIIISSITGKTVESVSENTGPQVFAPPTGTGAYVTAISNPSFESYGLKGNIGASLGDEEAKTIKAGLEYLLTHEEHYNNKFEIIHWYNNDDVEDLINEFLDYDDDDADNPDKELSDIFKCVIKGEKPNNIPDANYHIVKFNVPTKGREFLSNSHNGTYRELYTNLQKWYKDSELEYIKKSKESKTKYVQKAVLANLYGMFFSIMSEADVLSGDKYKKMNNMLGNSKLELLYSIYEGTQIPRIYFKKAITRFNNSMVRNIEPKRQLVQLIKVYLIRGEIGEDILMNNKKTKAYNCGRLFAVYEKIQKSSGNVKSNVTQRYFGAAQKAPQIFFPKLDELSKTHMKKITSEGMRIWLDKMLGEIAVEIGTEFPDKLSEKERGEFILGYYNQKVEMFKSKEN